MQNEPTQSRIIEAGVDVAQLAKSSVLIKIGDISTKDLQQHPVYPLSRGLAALGFGSIHLCGSADYFDVFDEIIQAGNFWQHPGVWLTKDIADTATDASIIIDLTNEPGTESFCSHLAEERSVQCLFAAWGESWIAISPNAITAGELSQLHLLNSHTEDLIPPLSRIIAGLALQESLMLAGGKRDLVAPLERTVVYNAAAENRTTGPISLPWKTHTPLQNIALEIVGAGALGIHLLESLIPMLGDKCEIRIFDFDVFGPENTPFSYCANTDFGRAKAEVMAERLVQICQPGLKISPFVMTYQQRPEELSRPTARIICADNFRVRHFANERSVFIDKVPLVEAGSSPLAGQQRTYYSGRTACLDHPHRIYNLAKKAAEEEQPASCSLNRALTLPGTNMIMGGILAIESLKVIDMKKFGLPSRGTIIYDARAPQRFGILGVLSPCMHHSNVEEKLLDYEER